MNKIKQETKVIFIPSKLMLFKAKLNILFESFFDLSFITLIACLLAALFYNPLFQSDLLWTWILVLILSIIGMIVFAILIILNNKKLKHLLTVNSVESQLIKKHLNKRMFRLVVPFEGLVLAITIWKVMKRG